MPLLPASLIEPLWVEFAALIGSGDRPGFDPPHPWSCHRRRIPDRLRDWAEAGQAHTLLRAALAAYDQMIGLALL